MFQTKAFEYDGKYDLIGSERQFGVELEYHNVSNTSRVEEECIFGGKYDCSLDDGGVEFYSPPMRGDGGIKSCLQFCRIAGEEGFSGDDPELPDQGYHLHVDLSDLTVEQVRAVFKAYHLTQEFWCSTVPSHRLESDWAKGLVLRGYPESMTDSNNLSRLERWAESHNRYMWANVAAYAKFGTVELRVHETSNDGDVVTNWIRAHVRFVDQISTLTDGQIVRIFGDAINDPPKLFREVRCIIRDPNVSEHLRVRYNRFRRKTMPVLTSSWANGY